MDYYKEVDREIGELLKFADSGTDVLVVSDSRRQANGRRYLRE